MRAKRTKWVGRARFFIGIELILSVIFDITMLSSIRSDQLMNILLIIVVALNIITSARLLTKLNGTKCASSIMAYVIWKIIQELIMLPVLVIFTFILIDKYLKSWNNLETAVQVLVIVWTYAIYSFWLIVFLAWLARNLWKRQNPQPDGRSEMITTISYIDGFTDDQKLLESTRSSTMIDGEEVELKHMNMTTPNTPKHAQPYDNVFRYISPSTSNY